MPASRPFSPMQFLFRLYRSAGLNRLPFLHGLAKALTEVFLAAAERLSGFRTPAGGFAMHRVEMLLGRYEAMEMALARSWVRPGQVVLDIGANAGYFARRFGRWVEPGGRVLAFEPNREIFPLLASNLRGCPAVECHNLGLSDTPARMPFFVAGTNHATGSLVPGYSRSSEWEPEKAHVRELSVELVQGDAFLESRGVRQVNFIKLDVEGWELPVLRGLRQTLDRSPEMTLTVELRPLSQRMAGFEPGELCQFLREAGFSLFELDEHGEPVPLDQARQDALIGRLGERGYTSLLAIK